MASLYKLNNYLVGSGGGDTRCRGDQGGRSVRLKDFFLFFGEENTLVETTGCKTRYVKIKEMLDVKSKRLILQLPTWE